MVSRTPSRRGRADVLDGLEKYFLSKLEVLGRGHYPNADAETLRYAYMKVAEWRLAMGISAGSEFGWISLWAYPEAYTEIANVPVKLSVGVLMKNAKTVVIAGETALPPVQRKASNRYPTENNMFRASR